MISFVKWLALFGRTTTCGYCRGSGETDPPLFENPDGPGLMFDDHAPRPLCPRCGGIGRVLRGLPDDWQWNRRGATLVRKET